MMAVLIVMIAIKLLPILPASLGEATSVEDAEGNDATAAESH